MTSASTASRQPKQAPTWFHALASYWTHGIMVEPMAYMLGALLLASGLVHLFILLLSGGSWDGPLSLRKAASFGAAFGIALITIAWVTTFVRLQQRTRTALLSLFSFACVIEVVLVSMQAWRHVPSHFNVATPFDALVTRGLAIGGFLLVALITTFSVASFRANPVVPISMMVAVRAGFAALLASQVVGAAMIARGMTLVRRGDAQAAYATGGVLTPIHAALMTGILVLPLIAWTASSAAWKESRRLGVVLLAASGYLIAVLAVAIRNMQGTELSRLRLMLAIPLITGVLLLVAAALITLLSSGTAKLRDAELMRAYATRSSPDDREQ